MLRWKLYGLLMGVWSLGATAFIGYDRWNHFASEQLAQATERGRREILGRIIQETAKCRPFTVANGEENTELVGTRCLAQSQQAQAAPQNPALPR